MCDCRIFGRLKVPRARLPEETLTGRNIQHLSLIIGMCSPDSKDRNSMHLEMHTSQSRMIRVRVLRVTIALFGPRVREFDALNRPRVCIVCL